MTFVNCNCCRRQTKAVYQAYDKVCDLKACEPCTAGLGRHHLDLVSQAKSHNIF